MALWSRIRALLSGSSRRDPRIRLVEGGFDVVSSEAASAVASVRWQNVLRVHTYKIDLATTDCICLAFEFNSGTTPVQVSEEWAGFAELFAPLAAAFPTISPDWYAEVMTPAFKTNHRVLYDAGPSHSAAIV